MNSESDTNTVSADNKHTMSCSKEAGSNPQKTVSSMISIFDFPKPIQKAKNIEETHEQLEKTPINIAYEAGEVIKPPKSPVKSISGAFSHVIQSLNRFC